MKQRLGITVALCGSSEFLILDELAKVATHYGFINNGNIIKEISATELTEFSDKYVNDNIYVTYYKVVFSETNTVQYAPIPFILW